MHRKNQSQRKNARRLSIIQRNEKALRKADKGKPPMDLRGDKERVRAWRERLEAQTKLLKEKLDGDQKMP